MNTATRPLIFRQYLWRNFFMATGFTDFRPCGNNLFVHLPDARDAGTFYSHQSPLNRA